MPTRQDWLLNFVAGTGPDAGWVDKLQIMKGMFLFQNEGKPPAEVNYRFQPYDYGPFTTEVYRDLDILVGAGVVQPSLDGKSFRVTPAGAASLGRVLYEREQAQRLQELRSEVTQLSFRALLKRVYEAHPEFATKSRARDVLQ
ncbi:MAG: hypothetical protein IPN07_16850 [Dehalococcoidia bacterium]|nr:hypothetical protein [Dehalococcoidia bacterium]